MSSVSPALAPTRTPPGRHPLYAGLVVALAGCVLSAGIALLGSIEIERQLAGGFASLLSGCSTPGAGAGALCDAAVRLDRTLQQRVPVMLLMQGLGFALMLGAAATIVRRARDALVVRPLEALQFGAGMTPVDGHDEIERLIARLKQLAARQIGEDAQDRLGQHLMTQRARRHAEAVRILHAVARMYAQRHVSEASLLNALTLLESGLGSQTAAVSLLAAAQTALGAAEVVRTHDEPAILARLSKEPGWRGGGARMVPAGDGNDRQSLVVPLASDAAPVGLLVAEFAASERVDDVQIQLAEGYAHLTALAIAGVSHSQQERRMALMEERSAIAGELHDSLAQSLAFMKIQVARLQSGLALSEQPADVTQTAQELRAGLSAAYREVRELIAAFRVRMGPGGLVAAVQEAVDEFSQRSALEIGFHAALGRCHLEVNEEFHVIQVVREALSNAVRHARAQHVWIALQYGPGHRVVVTVDDDGRGPATPRSGDNHHGMNIMRERAGTLGGEIGIGPRDGGGTRVRLSFPPQRLPAQVADECARTAVHSPSAPA